MNQVASSIPQLVLATSLAVAGRTYEVRHTPTLGAAIERAKTDKPRWITYDVETSGLHLRKDRPFYGCVCWKGIVFVFPTTESNLKRLPELAALTKRFYAHNAIFDMCMTANQAGDSVVRDIKNWADSMCNARLIFEAISADKGGDSLALKAIGAKYIDKEVKVYEAAVKEWLKEKSKANRAVLRAFLKPVGWTLKLYDAAIKNETEFPEEVAYVVNQWRAEYPDPTYNDVPLEIMLPYLAVDGILTDILVDMSLPIIVTKEQIKTYERECRLIPVVYKMVRAGFKADREYLEKSLVKITDYLKYLEEQIVAKIPDQFAEGFKVTKHFVIKAIYEGITGALPASTDKAFLMRMQNQGDELAPLITKARTCSKWRGTYIEKLLRMSEYDGRVYPSLNQFNPVTGRFSGDFQQMPKDPLLTIEGVAWQKAHPNDPVPEEYVIFNPRQSIMVSGGLYNKQAYIDVSQYELRWGAHHTLKFGGDLNLCRAYMPFQCTDHNGVQFDPYNREHIERWDEKHENGNSVWMQPVIDERGFVVDHVPWKPTDVHSSTTIKALPAMGIDPSTVSKEVFDYWRQKGKRYNFLKFYGGGAAKAAEALEITLDNAQALNTGFEEAFPLLVTYSQDVIEMGNYHGYVENVYGRRYYLSKSYMMYKLGNYLIQGGTADDFKGKMILIDEFLVSNNCLSRMIHPIHDEIIMDIADGEDWVLDAVKKIIEHTPAVNVPIVAEVSITTTTWNNKKKVA